MSGRGRGKQVAPPSVAQTSFKPISIGIKQPTQFYPPVELPPIEPVNSNFQLETSKKIKEFMQKSDFYLQKQEKDFERYSDKYSTFKTNAAKIKSIQADPRFFPSELGFSQSSSKKVVEFKLNFEEFEANEGKESKEVGVEEENAEEEVEEEEAEVEEETDYNLTYFDDGDDYGDFGGDDADEGPVY